MDADAASSSTESSPSSLSTLETRWTLVLRACAGSESALNSLCETYRKALLNFYRRKGLAPEDAEDLVQLTLASLTHDGSLVAVEPSKGRFRSFLFRCATHEWTHFLRARAAAKRGGGNRSTVSWDEGMVPPSEEPPTGDLFDREWSLVVAERAVRRLLDSYARRGKSEACRALLPFLQAMPESGQYSELSMHLGVTEGNARVLVSRIRKEFRDAVLREVLDTVADPRHAEDEMRHLLRLWASTPATNSTPPIQDPGRGRGAPL